MEFLLSVAAGIFGRQESASPVPHASQPPAAPACPMQKVRKKEGEKPLLLPLFFLQHAPRPLHAPHRLIWIPCYAGPSHAGLTAPCPSFSGSPPQSLR